MFWKSTGRLPYRRPSGIDQRLTQPNLIANLFTDILLDDSRIQANHAFNPRGSGVGSGYRKIDFVRTYWVRWIAGSEWPCTGDHTRRPRIGSHKYEATETLGSMGDGYKTP